jgi:hypothetical protein
MIAWGMRFLLAITLVLVGCGQPPQVPSCPNTHNVRHISLPVAVKVSNDFTPAQKAAIDRAVIRWNGASGRTLFVRTDAYGSPVSLLPVLQPRSRSGVTRLSHVNGWIVDARIDISRTALDDDHIDLESLAIHELGHLLGLAHVTDTVMNPSLGAFETFASIEPVVLSAARCLYP